MEHIWWKEAVVYEIYCKSFCDSNGDGIGDLRGVMSKLPMLKELGINCIWFAPIYKSPMCDNGYDIADYQDIAPEYGTLEDFKELLDMAHSMGIRVIMDMALNHSSDEHYWFKESRKSKDNPYRDYYIWKPAKSDGSEPNNWGSYFREGNGSIWEWDETTQEYYFHQYGIKMPDLNWEHEPLRKEIYKMLNWWLDFGVDGFRLDVITRLKKMPGFPDTKVKPDPLLDRNGFVMDKSMCADIEGIHEWIQEMNREVFSRPGCFTVGEGAGINYNNALPYIQKDRKELNSFYHFQLSNRKILSIPHDKFRDVQSHWADLIAQGGWAVQYLSNHDSARQVSCYGNDGQYRTRSAKLLATLIHTTPGMPFIYQGEEIGMVNVKFDTIEDYNCCCTVGDYNALMEGGMDPKEAIDRLAPLSRDNARTPYQWDNSENAGFTTGKPWLKLNPTYTKINLEADRKSEDSIFAFYQTLIRMRKEQPAIIDGDLKFLLEDNQQILMYLRRCDEQTMLVITNYSGEEASWQIPEELKGKSWKRILTNVEDTVPSITDGRTLLPWEAEVYVMGE